MIDISSIRRWDKWDKHAREFMDSIEGELPLHELAEKYMQVIAEFHLWQINREREVNGAALDEVRKRVGRLKELNSKAFPEMADRIAAQSDNRG